MASGKRILKNFIIIFISGIVAVSADLVILKSPNYVRFVDSARDIETAEIGPMIAASFGLSLDKDLRWDGLEETNLFKRPKATAVISVTGVPKNKLFVKGVATYGTVEVESSLSTDHVTRAIENVHWKNDPLTIDVAIVGTVIDVITQHREITAGLPTSLFTLREDVLSGVAENWFSSSEMASLSVTSNSEFTFMTELYVVKQIVNTLLENKATLKTSSPDFFHFAVSGLQQIAAEHGFDSVQFGDAVKLLQSVVTRVSDQLETLYGGNIVIEMITFTPDAANQPRGRRVRRADNSSSVVPSNTEIGVNKNSLNLAPSFSSMYSAIFNICLWFMIILAIVVFYIAWAIWFMDPGRDSIIYRMTSTRMKRD